jgi:hypothetical protein
MKHPMLEFISHSVTIYLFSRQMRIKNVRFVLDDGLFCATEKLRKSKVQKKRRNKKTDLRWLLLVEYPGQIFCWGWNHLEGFSMGKILDEVIFCGTTLSRDGGYFRNFFFF